MVRTAPELEQAAPDEDAEASGGGRKRLLLLAVPVLVVTLAGAFFLLGGSADDEEPPPVADGAVVEVAQMTVNLAGPELHYTRFGFAVVLQEDVAPADVEGRFPLLQDAALSEIQRFPSDVLRTPDGLQELRERLTARAQNVYPDGEVLRVVLTELVVQ